MPHPADCILPILQSPDSLIASYRGGRNPSPRRFEGANNYFKSALPPPAPFPPWKPLKSMRTHESKKTISSWSEWVLGTRRWAMHGPVFVTTVFARKALDKMLPLARFPDMRHFGCLETQQMSNRCHVQYQWVKHNSKCPRTLNNDKIEQINFRAIHFPWKRALRLPCCCPTPM